MAADRSDDIKQLFSHLGLNPGDYQEIRERSRAAPRGESLMPPTAAQPATPPTIAPAAAPPPTLQIPPTVPVTAMPAPPEPVTIAPPPLRQAPTVAATIAPPPAPAAVADTATRWSLLRAAVETPTRVAQIDRTQAPATPAVQTAEIPMPVISEDAPTRRLFQELSRRPVDEAVDQLTEAARRRWQQPAAAEPAPPQQPTYQAISQPQPPFQQPAAAEAPPAAAQFSASGELLSTFQRLVAPPSSVPQQKPARMRFNYDADAKAPRAMQPREENLDDVFSRISDPRLPR
jgi:hypothetical protein